MKATCVEAEGHPLLNTPEARALGATPQDAISGWRAGVMIIAAKWAEGVGTLGGPPQLRGVMIGLIIGSYWPKLGRKLVEHEDHTGMTTDQEAERLMAEILTSLPEEDARTVMDEIGMKDIYQCPVHEVER